MKLMFLLRRYFYYYRKLGWQGINIFKRLNGNNKPFIKVKLNSIQSTIHLRSNSSDVIAFEHIFLQNQYKIQFDFKPRYILDLGANIGLASIYFKNRFPNAGIFAVEPDADNFEILQKNTQPYKNIHCLQCGIWNKPARLKIIDTGEGAWSYVTRETDALNENATIEGKSIDAIMQEYNIPQIDILKIDIEGAEKEIFETGFDKWLPKVRCIVIELHDRSKKGCAKTFFKALSSYDFSLRVRHENLICDLRNNFTL